MGAVKCAHSRCCHALDTSEGNGTANLTTGLLGPQAWHCLLDMRSPLEPPTTWGYGLAPSSRADIESSFATMSRRERRIMSMELLRVLSAVLADIAQAVTNALDQAGEEGGGPEEEEGDGNSMVQALSVSKAEKLREASKPREIASLWSPFDKLTRSSMATMERMASDEARRTSQALANKLVAKYGVREPAHLPPDAECLLSGFIAFGAEFMEKPRAVDADGQILRGALVGHGGGQRVGRPLRWLANVGNEENTTGSLTSCPVTASASGLHVVTGSVTTGSVRAASASGTGPCPLTGGATMSPVRETSATGLNESTGTSATPMTQMLNSRVQDGESARRGTDEVTEDKDTGRQRSAKRKDWSLTRATRSKIDLDGPDLPAEAMVGSDLPAGPTAEGTVGEGPHAAGEEMRRAMELECTRLAAAHYREWEQSVMEEAMGRVPDPPGVQVVIRRGGVRPVGGWQAPTQSMSFRLHAGEMLDLRTPFRKRTAEVSYLVNQ